MQTQLRYSISLVSRERRAFRLLLFILLAICRALYQSPALRIFRIGLTPFFLPGTAIYFLSPLWPYNVNTAISLDSSPVSLIDLVDHGKPDRNQGSESVPSGVVWSASRLSNTQHILRISVGAGQSFAIVDALV